MLVGVLRKRGYVSQRRWLDTLPMQRQCVTDIILASLYMCTLSFVGNWELCDATWKLVSYRAARITLKSLKVAKRDRSWLTVVIIPDP